MSDDKQDDDGPAIGNVVETKYREKYGKVGHTDDPIARALEGVIKDDKDKVDPDALDEVAKKNGIDMLPYSHLNIGMQRMTVSNRLRGMHNQGHDVTIGDRVIKGDAEGKKNAGIKAKAKQDRVDSKAAREKEKAAKAEAKAKEKKESKADKKKAA